MEVKVYHLFHSGVAVKTRDTLLIFDYYKDRTREDKRKLANGVVSKKDLMQKDSVYVFVSHSHGDHFNPVIFKWKEINKNIKYILSSDIKISKKTLDDNEKIFISKDKVKQVDKLTINTFGSTDKGVSYLVNFEDMKIFHAGDLNWWKWKNISAEKQKIEEKDFKFEVDKLNGEEIDIAFIPVDPRLEDNYYLAGEYFIKTIKPELLVPIHFNNNYNITEKFAERMEKYTTETAVIDKKGDVFTYKH